MNASVTSGLSKIVYKRTPVSHIHIFLVIGTFLKSARFKALKRPLRILDIGCGDGHLIDSLLSLTQAEMPDTPIEIFGFDISEQGFRDDEQKNKTEIYLETRHPDTVWKDRIKVISGNANWGYDEGFFDIAISNQVIEHVRDLDKFLENLRHSLSSNGVSIHLFPLSHCVEEAHCHVPFAHWISNFDYRIAWIALVSKLGVGRYRRDSVILGHHSPKIHALETAKYIQCWTTYRSYGQVAALCRNRSMSISYHYTKDFYFTKLRRMLGLGSAKCYHKWTLLGLEWLSFMICRYLSSSTLLIRPVNYDIGTRIAAEKAELNRV